jgi:hypothetical protein
VSVEVTGARTGILTDVVIETEQGSGEFFTGVSTRSEPQHKALKSTDLYRPS